MTKVTSEALGIEPIGKLLIKQAVPASIGILVMSLNILIDSIFVGNWIGSIAFASINVVLPVSFFIGALGMSIGVGGSSIISRALGSDDKGKAEGLNGSVSVNTGIPDNHGASLNLNYRSKNFNIFNTSGYNYRDIPGRAENNSENFFSDNRFVEEDRDFDRIRNARVNQLPIMPSLGITITF